MPSSSTSASTSETHFEGDLTPGERFWVDLQPWLRDAGYDLRSRYQPGWQPSWLNDGENAEKPSLLCEDGVCNPRDNVLDAIKILDGGQRVPVTLKTIKAVFEDEIEYLQFFAQKKLRSDSRNHCISLIDVLSPPSCPDKRIMVFPRLVPWDVFPFARVSEALDFFGQTLEGLAFMHEQNFAHRDASWGNVMMDGLHLFHEPPHPSRPSLPLCGDSRAVRHIQRCEAGANRPVRYLFIDFGLSVHFPSREAREPGRGPPGQDRSAPELKGDAAYDPFALDVYCLGNLFFVHWLNAYANVEFMRPLVADMMHPVPAARPTAAEALARFNAIRRNIPPKARSASLKRVKGYDWQEYVKGNVSARAPHAGLLDRLLRRRHTAKSPRARKDKPVATPKLANTKVAAAA
ncbi:hypothetical protein EXIGLDRAFT_666468 [Exidia glandulosa HHB12029]|uniref:Protein kinase domain-containing protein n=1 Tax=Exidia glandulosa HHB12029 TaxID=1314781 RepID=A0A165NTA6_EXIGL|nr:hypothetical protein EXIGLDRAFT_666468 [Exidia glandulosa HHB12029]